jgi:DNA-binding SARP family transcriptional activator
MEFRILGPLEVWHEGQQIVVRGSKQRALLAVLLLHANEAVSTDQLINQLWGDEPPDAGATALRVRLSQLRKALGSRDVIATRQPGYVLELGDEQLDLRRFERLVASAANEPPPVAADRLREALALWRGAPLAEFAYEDFAQPAIARLEELRVTAIERRTDADLALGRHADLVPELEELVEEHPLRETPVRQLMVALYRSGRQAEALEVYRLSRARLVGELGLEPTPGLQELERSILQHDPALAVAPQAVAERSVLVAPVDPRRFDDLVAVAAPLARHPPRELILAQVIASAVDLSAASALARERRESLQARGVSARSAAFTSERPGADLVRIANEQEVDLLVVDATEGLLADELLKAVLLGAPCDVGALVVREKPYSAGPILVPFTGAEHDWSAIEIAAWLARADDASLWIAGPVEEARDASRLLASASLAVQRALGVQAEPLLVEPGADGLLEAAEGAALVVVGLSDRWRREGLGSARHALVTRSRAPALVVRHGLRPGGLAPPESYTRFTWSIGIP